jgi:hypothetical protein
MFGCLLLCSHLLVVHRRSAAADLAGDSKSVPLLEGLNVVRFGLCLNGRCLAHVMQVAGRMTTQSWQTCALMTLECGCLGGVGMSEANVLFLS